MEQIHILRDYQEQGTSEVAIEMANGRRRVIYQLDTGGGKTIIFSTICHRFYKKQTKRVVIMVHREELMYQTQRTLKEWYNIDAQLITAETKAIFDYPVYIGMVETLFRRLQRDEKYLPPIGLYIIDEAHVGNFRKMHQFFGEQSLVLGFTATPLSSVKKDPLKNYYQSIVVGPGIPYLISIGSLCQNRTYSIKGIKRSRLKIRNGEFAEEDMGFEFSKVRNVQNTIKNYKKYAEGTKAIVFNCNIPHSWVMQRAFQEAGYQSKHVDGTTPDEERKAIFKWFKETPGAILNNVGIATLGFDEPSIETVIMNRATMSLTLWLQCCGRGSRPFGDKNMFTILDLGGNAIEHGDWCQVRDWKDIFYNPPVGKEKLDAAPMKDCPKCECLIPIQSTKCPFCGYEFPINEPNYDAKEVELELVTKNLDVSKLVVQNAGRKEYYTLFEIGNNIATQVKYKLGSRMLTDKLAERILEIYQNQAKEWCKLMNKRWDGFHSKITKDHLYKTFKANHGWEPGKQSIPPLENIKSLF